MELKGYIDNSEEKPQQEILKLCINYKLLDGKLLATNTLTRMEYKFEKVNLGDC